MAQFMRKNKPTIGVSFACTIVDVFSHEYPVTFGLSNCFLG